MLDKQLQLQYYLVVVLAVRERERILADQLQHILVVVELGHVMTTNGADRPWNRLNSAATISITSTS